MWPRRGKKLVGTWDVYFEGQEQPFCTVTYLSNGEGFLVKDPAERFVWNAGFGAVQEALRDTSISSLEVMINVLEQKWDGHWGSEMRGGFPRPLEWINDDEAVSDNCGVRKTLRRIPQ